MRICILTQPLHTNYGGLLQAYALQTVLKRMGHKVVTDRYGAKRPISFSKRILYFGYHFLKRFILQDKRYNPFQFMFSGSNSRLVKMRKEIAVNTERFVDTHIDTIDFFKGKNKPEKETLDQFEALVVGSDQVWRPIYSYIPAYFLDFAIGKSIKRIAYAASFGVDQCEFSPKLTEQCAKLAKQFDAISVREDSGVELCRKSLGVEAVHLLDPTLLLDKEDYLQLIEENDSVVDMEKRMMCYILDKTPEKRNIIDHISSELGLLPLEVMPEEKLTAGTKDATKCIFPSVSEWINGFRVSEFVVTDSFHGTVFAIIFNKPFVAILNKERGSSRFTSLLRIFNLEERAICSHAELSAAHMRLIDYAEVNRIRNEWKEKSTDYFKKNIL